MAASFEIATSNPSNQVRSSSILSLSLAPLRSHDSFSSRPRSRSRLIPPERRGTLFADADRVERETRFSIEPAR